MDRNPFFRPDGWIESELYDFNHAKSDDECRRMLQIFGYDKDHEAIARRLFPDLLN